VALFGHENASSEIRLKTFFEMSDHAMFYERVHAKTQIPAISPTFAQATKQCQQNGNKWEYPTTYPYGLMERSGKDAKTNLPLNRLTTSKISLGETWKY
jgi:hypothetical protein